jgi:hypothetical protein
MIDAQIAKEVSIILKAYQLFRVLFKRFDALRNEKLAE